MAEPTLHQGLKQRHLTMIAIGGVIGAGLFVGSGVVIKESGPGAFITYALCGARNPAQATENARAGTFVLSEGQLAEIDRAIAAHLAGIGA